MNTFLKDKKIAIIGAGPGGLTLARLLQLKGVEVKVYERDRNKSGRQQGATLDLHHESGLKALREASLIKEFKEAYRPGAERMTVTDNNMKVHYTERDEEPITDLDSEYARPEIDRGPLRDLLIASLHDNTVVWDAKFSALKKSDKGWELFFENGVSPSADFVVAADGANSKVRKYITDIPLIYSGVTIVEGNIYNAAINAPHLWQLTNEGKVYALYNKKSIVLSAKGEGSLSFYTSNLEEENWAMSSGVDFQKKEQVFGWFKKRFADWSDDWHELFLSDNAYYIARPQYYFPDNQSWQTQPDITMLGDAAHVTPPYGEGVNQAMLDALELFEALCIKNFSTMGEAIAFFEKRMVERTSEVTKESLKMADALHSEKNLEFMLNFFKQIER